MTAGSYKDVKQADERAGEWCEAVLERFVTRVATGFVRGFYKILNGIKHVQRNSLQSSTHMSRFQNYRHLLYTRVFHPRV